MRVDLVTGTITLGVVAAFAVQRDYDNPLAGVFPDLTLAVLTVLGLVLVVRGLVRPQRSAPFGDVRLPMLFASMALLAAWVLLLVPAGFLPGGVLAFLAITIFVRRRSFRPKHLLWDVPIAVAVVWTCFLVFTRVFYVPLPVPGLTG